MTLSPAKLFRNACATASVCMLQALPLSALTLSDYSRDRSIFDLGGAFGRDMARIPIAGSADPGTEIEVRLHDPETGAASAWVSVGLVGESGQWRTDIDMGASLNYYRAEARLAGSETLAAHSENRVGTGDVVAFFGQSELETVVSAFYSQMPTPVISEADRVQLTFMAGNGPLTHVSLSNETPVTAAAATMAEFWINNAPANRRLHLVDLAEAGTSRFHLADDDQTRRNWSDLQEVVDFVRADGTQIGLVIESWYASDAQQAPNWAEVFAPFYTGATPNGRAVDLGTTIDGAGRSEYDLDHILWDVTGQGRGLFEGGETALGVFGPHRFEVRGDMQNAITTAEGGVDFYQRNLEAAREASNLFIASDAMDGIALPHVLPIPLDYVNGRFEGGEVTNISHPSSRVVDGAPRFGLHMVNAALHGLNLVSYTIPEFDGISWGEDYIEVWSSAGDITTTRLARGMVPLDGTYDHWTDVIGFELNGQPVGRAEIVEGRIRIYPLTGATEPFDFNDILTYRSGGASGGLNLEDDWLAQIYLNTAIVDVGLIGLEGVAVMPMTRAFRNDPTLWRSAAAQPPSPVPVPAGALLLFGSLGALRLIRRRRRAA